ncbi:peptidyl-prolyl cis-trans isomerase FKBP8 [Cimex lectularius]|uniref:peptidylprolyl isomerase n=1 Tax=Cimex lectularius TaxID=79782 RepID=A0A8I6RVY7_CIMLE|nr:peptidyl-prolyl cis-trans isomerase FKBP8 [Cimex lectularius]
MDLDRPLENSAEGDKSAIESFLQGERGDVPHQKPADEFKSEENRSEGESKTDEEPQPMQPEPESEPEPAEKEEWMDILGNGQLKKKVLKPGEPDSRPTKPDVCEISFEGRLEDGTVVDKEDRIEVFLGDNDTAQGIDFALALMDKGEEAEVVIASRFAYGSLGRKPDIPPDAVLTYRLTLHNVRQELPVQELDIEKRIAIGLKKKERGNWWYTRDEHTLAIHSYRSALEYLDDTDIPGSPDESRVHFLLDERLKTYNNLGASQMKISAYDAALTSFGHVLSSQPTNIKAIFRKAKILKVKGELEESIEVVRHGLTVDPGDKSLQQELSLLLAAQRKDNTKQRNLYKKMMGNSTQDNGTEKKKQKSSNYGTITLIAVVSFAVAAIGAVVVRYKIT